jgi:hypothetical protein
VIVLLWIGGMKFTADAAHHEDHDVSEALGKLNSVPPGSRL